MWEIMSVDEYAALERVSSKFIFKKQDVYWRQVRPFYSRALLPFLPLQADALNFQPVPPFYQWPELSTEQSNSWFNILVFKNMTDYAIDKKPKSFRKAVKKAREAGLEPRVMKCAGEFYRLAFPLYQNAYQRTGFVFQKSWLNADKFKAFSDALFKQPKLLVLGVFRQGQLLSVEMSARVNDVVVLKSAVNSDDALKCNASDFVLDYYWSHSKRLAEIRCFFDGYWSTPGINRFKLRRGAKALAVPARINATPGMLQAVRRIKPAIYRRIVGMSPLEQEQQVKELQS